jgi:hypothetical protein
MNGFEFDIAPFSSGELSDEQAWEDKATPTAPPDVWVDLEPPHEVFPGIVPGTLRLDETRVGKNSHDAATACDLGSTVRLPLARMLERPNRWICKLQIVTRDPDDGALKLHFGSGLLIGERHVLTAAHNLVDLRFDGKGRFVRALDATAVVVIPGLNGRGRRAGGTATETMPFGWTHGTAFRTARVYRVATHASGTQPRDFDYAVIRLADPIASRKFAALGGAVLGHWGYAAHGGLTRINPTAPGSLIGVKVNAVGYPQDKCRDQPTGRVITSAEYAACPAADLGSVPWFGFDRIISSGTAGASFATMELATDLAPSMSGGPVWLRWNDARNLIGIVQACDATKSKDNPFVGALATLITASAKREIDSWLV